MMIKGLFGGTMPLLERSLDLTDMRQKLITSNIANEETPGYKARDIDFKKELASMMNGDGLELRRTHQRHLPMATGMKSDPNIIVNEGEGEGLDGNTVSLEGEMVKMAENGVMHSTAITLLTKKLNGLKTAITPR